MGATEFSSEIGTPILQCLLGGCLVVKQVPKQSIVQFFRAGSGTVFSQVISFVCVPILFRLYSPEAFGVWATTMSIVLAIGTVATLRYELAIVVEREHQAASIVFWLTMLLGIALSLLFGSLLGVLGAGFLSAAAGGLNPPILAVCAWIILVAVGQCMQGWLLRGGAFTANSQIQVCNALVTNSVHLVGGWLGASSLWLVSGSMVGQAVAVAFAMALVAKSPPARPTRCWSEMRKAAIRHRRFAFFSTPFTLLTIARERAPILLLAALASPVQVGWYSQAWRLVSIPAGLSSGALRPVMFHAAADKGLAGQEWRVGRILLVITLLGAPWLGVLAYDPRVVFGAVLGATWSDAGTLAAILAVPAFFFALSNWMDRFLDLQGRQDINLWTELVTAVLSIGILWIGLSYGLTLREAVMAQAFVLVVCYVGFIVVTYRIAGFRRGGLIRTIALSIVLAVAFGLMTFLIGTQVAPLFAIVFSAVIAGIFGVLTAAKKLRGWA